MRPNRCTNEIRKRRRENLLRQREELTAQVFDRAERELDVPRAVLLGNAKHRYLRPLRGQVYSWLGEAGMPTVVIAEMFKRHPRDVRAGMRETQAAKVAVSARGPMLRSVGHG